MTAMNISELTNEQIEELRSKLDEVLKLRESPSLRIDNSPIKEAAKLYRKLCDVKQERNNIRVKMTLDIDYVIEWDFESGFYPVDEGIGVEELYDNEEFLNIPEIKDQLAELNVKHERLVELVRGIANDSGATEEDVLDMLEEER